MKYFRIHVQLEHLNDSPNGRGVFILLILIIGLSISNEVYGQSGTPEEILAEKVKELESVNQKLYQERTYLKIDSVAQWSKIKALETDNTRLQKKLERYRAKSDMQVIDSLEAQYRRLTVEINSLQEKNDELRFTNNRIGQPSRELISESIRYFAQSKAFSWAPGLRRRLVAQKDLFESRDYENHMSVINRHVSLGIILSKIDSALAHQGSLSVQSELQDELKVFSQRQQLSAYQQGMIEDSHLLLDGWCDAQLHVKSVLRVATNSANAKVRIGVLEKGRKKISSRYQYLRAVLHQALRNYEQLDEYRNRIGSICE